MRKVNPWFSAVAVYMISISVIIAQFKVPPIMGQLIGQYHLTNVLAGWLMSIFAVTAIILAFPGAIILKKLGGRKSGLIAISSVLIGTLIGYIAPSLQILMLSRVIEGLGYGMIAVIAPSVIAATFPPEKRGLPLGIWSAWVPIGITVIFAAAPNIAAAYGRQGVWLFSAGFSFVALVLYALFVFDNKEAPQANENDNQPQPSIFAALKYRGVWIFAIVMLFFNIAMQGYISWAPTYFTESLHIAPANASYFMSLQMIVAIVAAAFAGWLTDRIKNKKVYLIIALVVSAIVVAFGFNLAANTVLMYMVIMGVTTSFPPTVTYNLVPRSVPNIALVGIAMALTNLTSQIGALIAPPLFGAIAQYTGSWSYNSILMSGVMVLAIITMLFYRSKA